MARIGPMESVGGRMTRRWSSRCCCIRIRVGFARLGRSSGREVLAEAKATDEAEDELYGDERGDELPEQLRTREGRAEFFRQARERRATETADDQQRALDPEPVCEEAGFEFDTERIVARHQ